MTEPSNTSWQEHWFDWKGGKLHFLTAGQGDPVVLLHGGGADSAWRSWEDAPNFLGDLRLVAPDFPGFGKSELHTHRVDVPFFLEPMSALISELGLKKCVLVGFSTGGLIAARLALEQPERFKSLVLVAAAGLAPGIPFRPWANLVATFPGLHRVLYWGAGLNLRLMKLGMRRLVHNPDKLPADFLHQTRRMLRRPGAGAAWRQFLQEELRGDHFRHQVAGMLGAIELPTLLIHGRHDQLVPVGHSIQVARQISRAELSIMEDCGHWLHRESPSDFYARLLEFISKFRRMTLPGLGGAVSTHSAG